MDCMGARKKNHIEILKIPYISMILVFKFDSCVSVVGIILVLPNNLRSYMDLFF